MKNIHFLVTFVVLFCFFIIKMFVGGLGVGEAIVACFVLLALGFFKHNEKVLTEQEIASFKETKEQEFKTQVSKLENELGRLNLEKSSSIRRF